MKTFKPSASSSNTVNGRLKCHTSPSGSGNFHFRSISGTAIRDAFSAGYSVLSNTTTMTTIVATTVDIDE